MNVRERPLDKALLQFAWWLPQRSNFFLFCRYLIFVLTFWATMHARVFVCVCMCVRAFKCKSLCNLTQAKNCFRAKATSLMMVNAWKRIMPSKWKLNLCFHDLHWRWMSVLCNFLFCCEPEQCISLLLFLSFSIFLSFCFYQWANTSHIIRTLFTVWI